MDKPDEIRKRKGYLRWDKFQEQLSKCTTVKDVMAATHLMLDEMGAYGGGRAAELSKESLMQLVVDLDLHEFGVKYIDSRLKGVSVDDCKGDDI